MSATEAAICFVTGILLLRVWWKDRKVRKKYPRKVITYTPKEEDAQRKKDIADLKRQGYTDELIAVILPTIDNGE